MGASSNCQIFYCIKDKIKWAFTNSFLEHIQVFNYLDDFLLVANTEQVAHLVCNHFENLAKQLGIPLGHDKTVG